jgi:hypothetical protein
MKPVTSIRERRGRARARRLNRAVRSLPPDARRVMLEAIDDDELIIGAYTDRRGRTCPMLAAHRRGARIDVGDFPKAWDAFGRARRPRLATPRELEILRALLQESVPGDAPGASEPPVPAPSEAGVRAPGTPSVPAPPER